jgi:uncharacterized coiled-coil protein SlyX
MQDYTIDQLKGHITAQHQMNKDDIATYLVYLVNRIEQLEKEHNIFHGT